MDVYATSDIHVESKKNKSQIKVLLREKDFQNDTLILAGDISQYLEDVDEYLGLFHRKFKFIFYSPGNHDLWRTSNSRTSHDKIKQLQSICDKYSNVYYKACPIFKYKKKRVIVYPLLTWYDCHFDGPIDIMAYKSLCENFFVDYHLCGWKKSFKEYKGGVAEMMLNMNAVPQYNNENDYVITCSHFLPRKDLLPDKKVLKYQDLPKMMGCEEIDTFIRKKGCNSSVHVFGHSHINVDCKINNIRYVQNCFGYPQEKKKKKELIFTNPILRIDDKANITHVSISSIGFDPKTKEYEK